MKSRDKPGREQHQTMMLKLKKSAKEHSPSAKEQMKIGMKKIKTLKKAEQQSNKHSKEDLSKANAHMKKHGGQ